MSSTPAQANIFGGKNKMEKKLLSLAPATAVRPLPHILPASASRSICVTCSRSTLRASLPLTGIDLTLDGKTTHQRLNKVTGDVAEAISGVHLIMVVTPSFTHRMIASAATAP